MPTEPHDDTIRISRDVLAGKPFLSDQINRLAQAILDAKRCSECDESMVELMDKVDELEEKLHKIVNGEIAEDATVETYKAIIDRYEKPGQKCNSGHVNILPLKLWHCPVCAGELINKNVALIEIGNVLKEAADRDGQGSWVRMEGLDEAIKRWEELER